jgi:formiminotetrahydrofolate cyclodeaminase
MRTLTLEQLLEAIAAKTPAPGGGAVAALTAAQAAALARMVIAYSSGKPSLAGHAAVHASAAEQLAAMQRAAIEAADADARAFDRLNALMKQPGPEARRGPVWNEAVAAAIHAPEMILNTALDLLGLLDTLRGCTNRHLRSDLAIAAVLAEAAARAAAWNVRVNLPLLEREQDRSAREEHLEAALVRAAALRDTIERDCR